MAIAGRSFLFAMLCLALPGAVGAAAARSLETDYSVSVRGFPVGSARLSARFDDGRYTIKVTSRMTGLVRLFSDGTGFASANGVEAEDRLRPAQYGHSWTEEGDTESVRVAFAGADAKEIAVDPPVKRPERYVPVKAEHKRGVMDPASAFIWPTAGGDGPGVCDRVLPLFDGKRRFDLAFAYSRTERFKARDGSYSGPAYVCSIRYKPIAGHRAKKDSVRFMTENKDMEIWMAPTVDGGHVAPVKVRVGTKYGRVVLEAKRFSSL